MACYDRQTVRAVINVYLFIEHVIGNEAAASQIKHYVIHTSLMCIHRWAQYSHTSSYIVDKQPLDNDTHQLVRLKALTCKDSLLSNSGAIYDTLRFSTVWVQASPVFDLNIAWFDLQLSICRVGYLNFVFFSFSCWILKQSIYMLPYIESVFR